MVLIQMDLLNFHLIEYKGDIEGKTCAICKLELRSGQKIVQCSLCDNLFHEEHLVSWLLDNTDCPVCNRKILIEIEGKKLLEDDSIPLDITESDFLDRITDEVSLLSLGTSRALYNPRFSKRSDFIALRVIMSLLGLVFTASPIFLASMIFDKSTPIEVLVFVVPILSIFLFVGLFMLLFPNLKRVIFSFNWRSLEFLDDGIFIKGKIRSKEIKIDLEDIHSIELEQHTAYLQDYTDANRKLYNKIHYHIKLRINLTKKKHYYFWSISKIDSEQESNNMYQNLNDLLLQLYNIEVVTPFQHRSRFTFNVENWVEYLFLGETKKREPYMYL